MNKDYLTWIKFYTEFAEKLLPYMKDRQTLIEKIKAVAIDMRLKDRQTLIDWGGRR